MDQIATQDQPTIGQDSSETPGAYSAARFFNQLKEGQFGFSGQVAACLPNTMFQVEVADSQVPQLAGRTLLCTLAGKMRLHRIRVMPGDKVVGYVTKYDLQHGKITFLIK